MWWMLIATAQSELLRRRTESGFLMSRKVSKPFVLALSTEQKELFVQELLNRGVREREREGYFEELRDPLLRRRNA